MMKRRLLKDTDTWGAYEWLSTVPPPVLDTMRACKVGRHLHWIFPTHPLDLQVATVGNLNREDQNSTKKSRYLLCVMFVC